MAICNSLCELLAADESVVQGLAGLLTILVVASLDSLGAEGNHENESNDTESENEAECAAVALITGSTEEQAGDDNGRSGADSRTDGAHESEYATEVLASPVLSAERYAEVGGSAHEQSDEDHSDPEDHASANKAQNAGDNHEDAGDDHSLLGTDLGIDEADDVGTEAAEDHDGGHNGGVLLLADAGINDLHGLAHEADSAGEQAADSDGAEPELLALDGVDVIPNGGLLDLDLSHHDSIGDLGSEGLIVVTVSANLLGIVLDEDEADEPTNDGDDDVGQECAEDIAADTEDDGDLTHSLSHAELGEDGGGEGSEETVCNGECQSSDTHNSTLSGGEPLTNQKTNSKGCIKNRNYNKCPHCFCLENDT